jgi:uncharacterized protein (TIGR00661 family)
MNVEFEENPLPDQHASLRKLRILVAPLDWGLGHATRCIPVIYELTRQGCEVWLAAEGAQEQLLKQEFPRLNFLNLPGYRVKYKRSGIATALNIVGQVPKIITAIKQENKWLERMVVSHGFDAVISDNRYGLHHKHIPCIFITHQLRIKTPFGQWAERFLQKRNYSYINHFTACWIPDEAKESLAGELSHPQIQPKIPVRYIGWLSRFRNKGSDATAKKNNLLILLSGPEPQRSILEDILIRDIVHYSGSASFVRGLPTSPNIIPSTNAIRFFNHLPAEELEKEIAEAEYIIARSGYSTVMDIVTMQKRAILIPTPGQTEQEYLGSYLMKKQVAVCIPQQEFTLDKALQQAHGFEYHIPTQSTGDPLKTMLQQFLSTLQ